MRMQRGGVWHIGEIMAEDLEEERDVGLSKPQRIWFSRPGGKCFNLSLSKYFRIG